MSVSSVALSSVTAARNANTLLETAPSQRAGSSQNDKPAVKQDEQTSVKAAQPPKVGQVVDISA